MKRLMSLVALLVLACVGRADSRDLIADLAKEAEGGVRGVGIGVGRGRVSVRVGGFGFNSARNLGFSRGFSGLNFNRGFNNFRFGHGNRFGFNRFRFGYGLGFNSYAFRGHYGYAAPAYGYAQSYYAAPAYGYQAQTYSAPVYSQGFAAQGCPCAAEIAALSQQIAELASRLGVQ